MCLLNQVKEQVFFHYISIHEDVSVLSISKVWLHGENTFLFVDVQCLTVREMILRIVNRMIHQSDVSTGVNVCFEECAVVSCVNHVARRDHNILRVDLIKAVNIFHVSSDICAVDTIINVTLLEESNQFAAFGVDVVMTSCTKVFYERARFSTNINLHYIDSTVTHIRNWKVDYTISSKEREGTDRTVCLHVIYLYVVSCKVDNSKSFTHLIRPPLLVLQRARYSRWLRLRQQRSFQS